MFTTPERPLNPPEGREIGGHEWLASFACHIGDEGLPVQITAEVTRDDELDPESIQAFYRHSTNGLTSVPIDMSDVLNSQHRSQIAAHFSVNFSVIHGDCNA
jgi:hypothetical protein